MNTMTEHLQIPSACQNSRHFILQDLAQLKEEMIHQISNHSFLKQCRGGEISLDRLNTFLVQHGKYSRNFTRYICQLMVNLESHEDVSRIFENLFEELGLGETNEPSHAQIFQNMLQGFNLDLEMQSTRPSTQRLIDTMMNFCKQPEGVYGLAALCLGAEAIVPQLYGDIIIGFVEQGADLKQLNFFTLHIECDDGHTDTMLAILSRLILAKPALFEVVRHAAFLMIQARLEFLDDL